ncbi:hypothetical protein Emag_002718 [Eimeria magna]
MGGHSRAEIGPPRPAYEGTDARLDPRCLEASHMTEQDENEAPDEALRMQENRLPDNRGKWWHDKERSLGTTGPELTQEGVDVALEHPSRVWLAEVRTIAQDVTYCWGSNKHAKAKGDFLVAYIPYPLILGTDCLHQLKALWDLAKGKLRLGAFQPPIDVSLIERITQGRKGEPTRSPRVKKRRTND